MGWCRRRGVLGAFALLLCPEGKQHGRGVDGGGCCGSHESCFPDWRTWLRDPAMGLPYFGVKQSCLWLGPQWKTPGKQAPISGRRVGAGILVGMASSKLTLVIFVLNCKFSVAYIH